MAAFLHHRTASVRGEAVPVVRLWARNGNRCSRIASITGRPASPAWTRAIKACGGGHVAVFHAGPEDAACRCAARARCDPRRHRRGCARAASRTGYAVPHRTAARARARCVWFGVATTTASHSPLAASAAPHRRTPPPRSLGRTKAAFAAATDGACGSAIAVDLRSIDQRDVGGCARGPSSPRRQSRI